MKKKKESVDGSGGEKSRELRWGDGKRKKNRKKGETFEANQSMAAHPE